MPYYAHTLNHKRWGLSEWLLSLPKISSGGEICLNFFLSHYNMILLLGNGRFLQNSNKLLYFFGYKTEGFPFQNNKKI